MKNSTKSKNKVQKPNSQKKIIIIIAILTFIIVIGYFQRPTAKESQIEVPETPIEEPIESEQQCTEMWICQDAFTKAHRKSDCSFEQITDCPAGCENAECKAVVEEPEIIEKPKSEEPAATIEKPKQETEECTIGFMCLDDKRRGYQSSNCMFNQVVECEYGCKDNECITEAPEEKFEEGTFTLTQGKLIMNKTGWKYSDFSKDQIFKDEVYEQDLKIKLYATASGYDYYRAESYRADLWAIEKKISESTKSDCMEDTSGTDAYINLKTDQTLCIQTREKDIALVGGSWEGLPKEDTELTWKYYVPK